MDEDDELEHRARLVRARARRQRLWRFMTREDQREMDPTYTDDDWWADEYERRRDRRLGL